MAKKPAKAAPRNDLESPRLYAITFPEDYGGPAGRQVRLPHGAVVPFDLHYQPGKPDPAAPPCTHERARELASQYQSLAAQPPGLPYLEWELTPLEAAEYAKAGLQVEEIQQSRYTAACDEEEED